MESTSFDVVLATRYRVCCILDDSHNGYTVITGLRYLSCSREIDRGAVCNRLRHESGEHTDLRFRPAVAQNSALVL